MNEPLPLFPIMLPSVPFCERNGLPKTSGIYFALSSDGTVLYVGASYDLHQRWKQHHRFKGLEKLECATIAYYTYPLTELNDLERAMISQFTPILNGQWHHFEREDPGCCVSPKSFRLSSIARQLLSALAEKDGITEKAVIELALREKAARAKIKLPPTQGDSP